MDDRSTNVCEIDAAAAPGRSTGVAEQVFAAPLIAALSDRPETIDQFALAVARRRELNCGIDGERDRCQRYSTVPWYDQLIIVDLATRRVVIRADMGCETWRCEDWPRKSEDRESEGAWSSVWRTSYSNLDLLVGVPAQRAIALTLQGLASHLSELIRNLRDAVGGHSVADALGDNFRKLRTSVGDDYWCEVDALIDPFTKEVEEASAVRPDLRDQCADMTRQLNEFSYRCLDQLIAEDRN